MLSALLVPVVEWFDRWDTGDVGSDTELAVFAVVLALAFVLLLSRLIANLALLLKMRSDPREGQHALPPVVRTRVFAGLMLPQISPPLQI